MASDYAFALNDLATATYLKNEFVSKFDETSSVDLIGYVYHSLSGVEPSEEEKSAAKLMLTARW